MPKSTSNRNNLRANYFHFECKNKSKRNRIHAILGKKEKIKSPFIRRSKKEILDPTVYVYDLINITFFVWSYYKWWNIENQYIFQRFHLFQLQNSIKIPFKNDTVDGFIFDHTRSQKIPELKILKQFKRQLLYVLIWSYIL